MNFVKMTLKPQILVSIYLKVKPIDSDNTFLKIIAQSIFRRTEEEKHSLLTHYMTTNTINAPFVLILSKKSQLTSQLEHTMCHTCPI